MQCSVCDQPVRTRYGVCQRTPACLRIYRQRWREAHPDYWRNWRNAHHPDMTGLAAVNAINTAGKVTANAA